MGQGSSCCDDGTPRRDADEEQLKDLPQQMSDQLLRSFVPMVPHREEEEQVDYATKSLEDGALRPETELKEKLFGWPEEDFSKENCVRGVFGREPVKQVCAGENAIDFTLPNVSGGSVSLGALLKDKPVAVCGVALSCPHCMAWSDAMNDFHATYGAHFHCVAVSSMQPHPEAPDRSFETGEVWELPYSKGVGQERTMEDRLRVAGVLQKKLPGWIVLSDDLDARVNPFWSTYGPAPRCAFIIHTTGLVCHSQLWWEAARAHKAADDYIAATSSSSGGADA